MGARELALGADDGLLAAQGHNAHLVGAGSQEANLAESGAIARPLLQGGAGVAQGEVEPRGVRARGEGGGPSPVVLDHLVEENIPARGRLQLGEGVLPIEGSLHKLDRLRD